MEKIKHILRRRRRTKRLNKKFLSNSIAKPSKLDKKLIFNSSEQPLVSIIIPFYEDELYTKNCLFHLHQNLDESYLYEIILIDDNSRIDINLMDIKGIHLIKNETNLGFLKNINKGIDIAKGEYIYILNNDTEVQEGFLKELIFVFENFKNVGAVGSMILNSDRTLQEAGSVILKNLEIHQVRNKREVFYPDINYIKRTDYCSGCSLLYKKYDDFGNINYFDEQFAPAYFEETDLCFSLKFEKGKHIFYTPFSKVLHYDGVSYNQEEKSTPSAKKQVLFEANRYKFQKKWKKELDKINSTIVEDRILELYEGNSITFFAMNLPEFDKDSGSNRFHELILFFLAEGYHVSIVIDQLYLTNNAYIEIYQRLGVLIFFEHMIRKGYQEFISKHLSHCKIAWFYGPDPFLKYLGSVKKQMKQPKIVYDMIDIHHIRLEKSKEFEKVRKSTLKEIEKFRFIETNYASQADLIITITQKEEEYMKNFLESEKIITVPNIHYPKVNRIDIPKFNQRKDLLFIGSVHQPNIDAINYLYHEIMPIVWQEIPDIKVNIIGNIDSVMKDFSDDRVIFHGYVPDITNYFNTAKLMVVPLRYGAGMKGKIGQAFEYYLPVVTTDIGAEGMSLENEANVLIANQKNEFAQAILRLYNSEDLWNRLSINSENSLKPFCKENVFDKLRDI